MKNRPSPGTGTAFFGSLALLVMTGCRPHNAPEAEFFATVPLDGWSETNVVELTSDLIPQGDSIPFQSRRINPPTLWIRYNLDASEYIPLVMQAEGYGMDPVCDTIRIPLFESYRPRGRGNRGVCELPLPLPKDLIPFRTTEFGDSILLPAGWRLTLYPLAPVRGISEIGVSF